MSATLGIRTCVLQASHAATKGSSRSSSLLASHFATAAPSTSRRNVASFAHRGFKENPSGARAGASLRAHSLLLMVAGASALTYVANTSPLRCEGATSSARPYAEPHTVSVQGPGSARLTRRNESPAVESSVDLKSLSFGAVAGISTGVFIKKGLKAVGFLLGGAFVFLQYMASRGMVDVDWRSMASRYDKVVDGYAGAGVGSRAKRLSSRVVDFLLADFPPRATFTAGLVLGLRIG